MRKKTILIIGRWCLRQSFTVMVRNRIFLSVGQLTAQRPETLLPISRAYCVQVCIHVIKNSFRYHVAARRHLFCHQEQRVTRLSCQDVGWRRRRGAGWNWGRKTLWFLSAVVRDSRLLWRESRLFWMIKTHGTSSSTQTYKDWGRNSRDLPREESFTCLAVEALVSGIREMR